VFGVVSTLDGTHNTTKHEESTLLTCACQDSFGSLCQSGASYAASESLHSLSTLVDVLGIALETAITDASKASFALAGAKHCGHILCHYHFRKLLSQAMEHVDAAARKSIWNAVMKCLKWQGFKTDDELVQVKPTKNSCLYFTNSQVAGHRCNHKVSHTQEFQAGRCFPRIEAESVSIVRFSHKEIIQLRQDQQPIVRMLEFSDQGWKYVFTMAACSELRRNAHSHCHVNEDIC
jgi:hypothetical protein